MTIDTREIIIAALFGAWALVMPVFFHMLGLGGIFLPMLIPLLTMGFIISIPLAALNGFMIPFISSFLTGMPPLYPPLALVMAFEGAALAATASLAYRVLKWNLWISLLLAIAAERIVLAAAAIWIAPVFSFPPFMLSLGSLTASLPGIILMIFIVPIVIKGLEKFYSPLRRNGQQNPE